MSLIVEDGTVVAGAESYASVAAANVYHGNRGNVAWGALASDTVREQSLRKATDYMIEMYRPRWKGFRKMGTQTLDWPRSFVYLEPFVRGVVGTYPFLVPDTIVPVEIINVCCELALKSSVAELSPDLGRKVVSVTVGPISTTYDKNSRESVAYRAQDLLLAPYLKGSAFSAQVLRS